ncbi:hypothetical protein KGV52_00425 [Candidatus Gracilibacteria bacterium]|nr:hypothetical protein [Candidatus Gracilibacteria bacterium]
MGNISNESQLFVPENTKLTNSEDLKLLHLNTNMGLNVRDDIRDAVYGTLVFFGGKNPENIYKKANIENSVNPLVKEGADMIGLTEVFGKQQVEKVREILEGKGYNTYVTPSFDMWSQDIEGEKLYNVEGFAKGTNEKLIDTTEFYCNREGIGKLIALVNLLSGGKGNKNSVIEQSKHLQERMKHIQDGAFTTFQVGDMNLTHGHMHSDNPELFKYLAQMLYENQVIFGDFNIRDIPTTLLSNEMFNKYQHIFDYEDTYNFAKGVKHLPGIIKKPDTAISNGPKVNIETIGNTPEYGIVSDHAGLRLKITQ